MIKQLFEQSAKDHGIGNVCDLHLVKAQQPRVFGKVLGNWRDRIGIVFFLGLTITVHTFMHVLHEIMEMNATLFFNVDGFIKQIHQH